MGGWRSEDFSFSILSFFLTYFVFCGAGNIIGTCIDK